MTLNSVTAIPDTPGNLLQRHNQIKKKQVHFKVDSAEITQFRKGDSLSGISLTWYERLPQDDTPY